MKSHTCSKRQFEKSIIALLAAVCGLFTLAGCASMQPASEESLLKSAGFQERTPTTEKQKTAYQKLPAYPCTAASKGRKAIVSQWTTKARRSLHRQAESCYQQYRAGCRSRNSRGEAV
jgi:hypothetical protein